MLTRQDIEWLEARGAKLKEHEYVLENGHFVVRVHETNKADGTKGVCCCVAVTDTGLADPGTIYVCIRDTLKSALGMAMQVMTTRWGRMAQAMRAMEEFDKDLKGQ